MFEFVDETDFRIAELKAFFPGTSQECIDNLLRVLVFQREEQETCSCLLKGESTGQYFPCDLDMKIRLEISKWVEALQAALDRNYELLKKIGPALFAVCEQDYPYRAETIARTLRMFLLCEALILKERCSRNNPYKDSVKDLLALTQAEDIIQQVRGARTVLTGNCQLSLALALLIAIGESQCEHFQAFSWEAYSAGRARDALLRQWPQMSDVQAVIDLIAVLIRCQSAVGQAVRGSGSWQLIERFACHPEEDPANKVLAFTNKERIAALRLMSIVEEGRNHLVPILVGRVRVDGENVGASDAWNRDEFLDRARKYVLDFGSRHKLPVYSYMRAKHVLGPQHNCCEKTVTRLDGKIKALKDTISRRMGSEMKDYCTASFGQEQVKENLRSILQMVLEGFPDDEDRQDAYFKENFRVFGFQIPDDYSLNRKEGRERTLKVLLQDFLVAERLVFPGATSSTLLSANEGPKNDDESAARLFQHLLDRAKDIMGDSLSPECGHWREKRKKGSRRADDLAAYIPFPLVRRISEVVYLLRRDRCFSLPVVIDNRQQPRWIRIPADVKKDADHLQQIIANFLLGSVLNQAMAQAWSMST